VVRKLTKHFQIVSYTFLSAGHVFLFPSSPETVSCGEVKTILCYADRTPKVTVAARYPTVSFGSHTYQRNSPRLAKVGPVELNLTDVFVSPVKDSLSNFNITASERHNGTIIITCADVYNSSEVQIITFSKGCLQVEGQIRFDETRRRLEWDEPTCEGWRQDVLSHYTATIQYTTGITKTYKDLKEPFIGIAEPFVQASVNMTNICGERTTLGTLNYVFITANTAKDNTTKGVANDGGSVAATRGVYWGCLFFAVIKGFMTS
jgi:hypothetical protein